MNQVSPILRRAQDRLFHWCPACEEMHAVYFDKGWKWNGDMNRPTFTPSFKHGGLRTEKVNGRWTGEWVRGPDREPLDGTCHYIITDGKIHFCPDSWHRRSDIVQMPIIPPAFRDGDPTFGIETQD